MNEVILHERRDDREIQTAEAITATPAGSPGHAIVGTGGNRPNRDEFRRSCP
ncbi:MAG: hypothetical protein HYR85_26100 [Planctomycetes bacterium]|nr:hypothetical protein [Planctomycetota bacterium]MBI3843541.1 hypothetical protein [Planctomycetota bacterium]